MNKYNEREVHILKALNILLAEFPNAKLSEANYKAYLRRLRDFPLALVLQAIEDVASDNLQFYPPAGVIYARAIKLREMAQDIPTAHEAWEAALSKWNPPRSEYLSHPNVDRAVRAIGGWKHLGYSDNLIADRARFLDAYRTFQDRDRQMARLPASVREHVAQLADENKKAQVDEAIAQLLAGKKK